MSGLRLTDAGNSHLNRQVPGNNLSIRTRFKHAALTTCALSGNGKRECNACRRAGFHCGNAYRRNGHYPSESAGRFQDYISEIGATGKRDRHLRSCTRTDDLINAGYTPGERGLRRPGSAIAVASTLIAATGRRRTGGNEVGRYCT